MLALPKKNLNIPIKIQELAPYCATIVLQIEKFIKYLGITQKNNLLVGLSGGADSLALTVVLLCLKQKVVNSLEVCHLNHGLRPEADQEAAWVLEFCKQVNIPCHIEKINIAEFAKDQSLLGIKNSDKLGLEEAGRLARYIFFERLRQKQQLDFIVTGHNLNDLAEDVLLRLLRGCGWPALSGMSAYDKKRKILRPLLLLERQKIEKFMRFCSLSYLTDQSNFSDKFLRNRLRLDILPILSKENPGFLKHIRSLWYMGQQDYSFWQEYLTQALDKIEHTVGDNKLFALNDELIKLKERKSEKDKIIAQNTLFLPNEALNNFSEAARLRVYKSCLEKIPNAKIRADKILNLDKIWLNRKTGKGSGQLIQFSEQVKVELCKDGIVFCY